MNNLVSPKTFNDVTLFLYNQKYKDNNIFSWILNHKVITLIIIAIIIYCIYKYYQMNKENFIFEYKNTLNKDNEYQLTADNSMDTPYIRPTFNPSFPVKNQTNYVRYLPDEYPRQTIDNQLIDNSGKLIKNGGILPDQGINDINYTYMPYELEQFKGPIYK